MSPLVESGPTLTVPLWINGNEEYTYATYDVLSPHTSKLLWKACSANKDHTLRTIVAADRAFPGWGRSAVRHRQEILTRVADSLEAQTTDFADYMLTEVGIKFGAQFLIPLAVRFLRNLVATVVEACESIPIIEEGETVSMLLKEPHGVVLGILPPDAPFAFGIRSAATAIVTGNTAILLAPASAPRCYWAIGKLFRDAGLAPGVLNVISCCCENAEAMSNTLIQNPRVKHMNFTGNAFLGRSIAGICARDEKECLIDVQGQRSMIVSSDADVMKAVNACLMGSYLRGCQICILADRLIVHRDIAKVFLSTLIDAFAQPGPHLKSRLSLSRANPKRPFGGLMGGLFLITQRLPICPPKTDPIDQLQLPGGRAPSAPAWMKDLFGPWLSYNIVATDEEACEIANKVSCGQPIGIFTECGKRGWRIQNNLPLAAAHINRMENGSPPSRYSYGKIPNESYCLFSAGRAMDEFLEAKIISAKD
ncbi:Aldehyde/histidinol dehydrogenase, partial [Amylocarpus encephaloides]